MMNRINDTSFLGIGKAGIDGRHWLTPGNLARGNLVRLFGTKELDLLARLVWRLTSHAGSRQDLNIPITQTEELPTSPAVQSNLHTRQ